MNPKEAQAKHMYKHLFLDAEGTLYVPRWRRSRWDFWTDPSPERALEFFEPDKGVLEALKRLRGKMETMCVVSMNSKEVLTLLLDKFGMADLFDEVMINGNKGKQISRYLNRHGYLAGESLMVGDMPSIDLYPVRHAGVEVILVDRPYNRYVNAERIGGVSELPDWLRVADIAGGIKSSSRRATLDDFLGVVGQVAHAATESLPKA